MSDEDGGKWSAYELKYGIDDFNPEYADFHRCGREQKQETDSFIKPCRYCGFAITMSNKSGNWLPYEESGQAHRCLGKK